MIEKRWFGSIAPRVIYNGREGTDAAVWDGHLCTDRLGHAAGLNIINRRRFKDQPHGGTLSDLTFDFKLPVKAPAQSVDNRQT